ncbi:hypothetical protein ABI59_16470 [Acidobacteria bacterium Mor1]|nr:hypothetical protein ABI59_16470 [Acidobacteria bacterium Mor1]
MGWTLFGEQQLAEFLGRIGPVDGVIRVAPETTHVHWRPIPWYEGVQLIRVYDPNWQFPKMALYFLSRKGRLFRLNGTSPPLHEMNAKAPIKLDEDNALDYLRFFCFFVHGEEGPFFVIERSEDPLIPAMVRSSKAAKVLEEIVPATLEKVDDRGSFHCSATLYYSNAIFRAEMLVHLSGMVEMLSDDPIAADLPAKVEAPLAWTGR